MREGTVIRDRDSDSKLNADHFLNDALLLNIQLTLILLTATVMLVLNIMLKQQFVAIQRLLVFAAILIYDVALVMNIRRKYLLSLTLTLCVTFTMPWICYGIFADLPQLLLISLIFSVVPIQICAMFVAIEILLPIAVLQTVTIGVILFGVVNVGVFERCLAYLFIIAVTTVSILSNHGYERQKKKIADDIRLYITSEHRLREESVRDSLTGLLNRRYLETVLSELTQNIAQYFGILMVDIDHFKTINDTFGHVVGDCILKQVADVLSKNHRSSDIACRYGGDEFIMLLINCSMEDAIKKAEAIRQQIAAMDTSVVTDERFKVEVSVGVAHFPKNGHDKESILKAVDQMLYAAKQKGRNLVVAAMDGGSFLHD